MAVFKTRAFMRFARKERIADEALRDAIARAERGLVDAHLGGGVIKQRIARPGEGRSGGFRAIIAFKAAERSVFVFGFAKSDRDNVGPGELNMLRKAAAEMLSWKKEQVAAMVATGAWTEVENER